MPAYAYEAVDSDGKTAKGVLEADSAKSARSLLRAQKLVPITVDIVQNKGKGSGLQREIWARPILHGTSLTIWTRQLAGLVGSGLPLERALLALGDESENDKSRNLVAALRAEVNAGAPLNKALDAYPREFSETYRAVIGSGEQSGQLGQVLMSLADDLEAQEALKNKVLAASLYPGIVSCIAVVIVIFLMTYVVPQVAQVFTGSKHKLPLLTTIMLTVSEFLRNYGWYILAVLLVGFFILRKMLKTEAFRLRWDAWWLTAPLFGKLMRNYHGARFASTLALLAQAGVPILRAMQTSAQTLSNSALRKDALEALDLVREGTPLGSALATQKRFPTLLPMFARLGEQTGQLPLMLSRAASQLSGEVQRRATSLATILEPLLVVGMGLVVMLIVLAVLMPIIELNQLVK